VVARVGGQPIRADDVARIAAAQGVDVVRARDIAVHDALLAREAAARGLTESPDARLSWDGELARRVLRRVIEEARVLPPTPAELDAAAARRWLEVDRPEGFRTVHAVVRYEAKDDDAKKARARAVAEAIRAAALPVSERAATLPLIEGAPQPTARTAPGADPDPLSGAFRLAVSAVPADGFQVVAEPLPAVSATGRLLAPGDGRLDPDFSRAAAALPARGALSPIVETAFGLHVILLLERTPALVLEGEARVARLRDEIVNERARAGEKRLLGGLRERSSVVPEASGLLGLVGVDR
jgi:peptidyl-prolyl cis-trans isomerase C